MESNICEDMKCFICGTPFNLERHHVFFGTANRKKAEEDGMWVWLCHDCHFGIHNGNNWAKEDLQRFAQECWEGEFGDREAFIKRYGRNYL